MFIFTPCQPFKHLLWMPQKLRLIQVGNIKSRCHDAVAFTGEEKTKQHSDWATTHWQK